MASLSTAKVALAPTIKSAFSYDSATLAVRKDRLCCQVPACQLSGKLVSRQQALDLARDLVKREEGGGYRCTKCGKLFSRIIGRKGWVTGQKGGGCWWQVSLHKVWQTLLQNQR